MEKEFNIGDRVNHKKYGKGTVIGFDNKDNNIVVEFDNVHKDLTTLWLSYHNAGLKKPLKEDKGLWCSRRVGEDLTRLTSKQAITEANKLLCETLESLEGLAEERNERIMEDNEKAEQLTRVKDLVMHYGCDALIEGMASAHPLYTDQERREKKENTKRIRQELLQAIDTLASL